MWSDYFHKESQYIQYQTFSPEDGRLILMRQNKETGDISYYHRRFPLIMKRSGELPYPVKEQPKIQWIANDICAITYISKDDDAMHQYVLTYGDRGQGSYYYVAVAMNGSWSGVEEGTQTWKIQSELGDNAGITLRLSGQLCPIRYHSPGSLPRGASPMDNYPEPGLCGGKRVWIYFPRRHHHSYPGFYAGDPQLSVSLR